MGVSNIGSRTAMESSPQSRSSLRQLVAEVEDLYFRREFESAETKCRELVSITERQLGAEHLEVAFVLHRLIQILEAQGKLYEATLLRERVGKILGQAS